MKTLIYATALSAILTISGCRTCPKADTGDTSPTVDTECTAVWWYPDNDGDGIGCDQPGHGLRSCDQPVTGWVTVGGDLDDCAGVQ